MASSEIEKTFSLLQGFGSGDADLVSRHIDPTKYKEHNPYSADGVDGLKKYVGQLAKEDHHLNVVRAFQDGRYVFTQGDGLILGKNTFFDVFRFEDSLVVEHWVFSAEAAPPNKSGHTQIDGPTEAKHISETEKNKAFMREYYETFHISGDHSRADQYFTGNLCIRHEPGVRDGATEFMRDVEVLMQHRTIDEVKLLLGQGDFVFIAATGTHEGEPCVYTDLYRVANEKIVEHWGFPEKVPHQVEWKNSNGERRRAMLTLPHMVPLTAYAATLRLRGSVEVPDFDPLDGGTEAQVLFLLEKPGPMTAQSGKRTGSGFISRNNNDATAAATFRFMQEAGIPRDLTVIWNVIPWWNGTVTVTNQELREGVECVKDLIRLLPNIRAVVLVGQKAATAQAYLASTGLPLFISDHPSPQVRARWPERWRAIPLEWAKVRRLIGSGNC